MTSKTSRIPTDEQIYEAPRWYDHLAYWFGRLLIYWMAKVYHRVRIRNGHRIPHEGPLVVICNHASHLDPPLAGLATTRRLRYMAKAELFEVPVLGRLLRAVGAFPVRRGQADRHTIRLAIQLVRNGEALIMFPEGTRSRTGELKEAQPGVAMVLNQVPEATIVPIRVEGSFEAWKPGRKFPKPRPVWIKVGEPFQLDDLSPLPKVRKELYQEIGRQLMKRIASI